MATNAANTQIDRQDARLCERLQKQLLIAEALRDAAAPHGDTMTGAYPMLKVLELAAAEHAQSLAEIVGLAKIISERVPA